MDIDQVLVTVTPGDAVTNAAFELRALLRRIARSEIYARFIHPDLEAEVVPINDCPPGRSRHAGVLVYHASIGDPYVLSFLLGRPERIVLLYHNITPAEYFAALDPEFAKVLTAGRGDLIALRSRVAVPLAVSAFNAAELSALGYRDVRVSPLPVNVAALRDIEPDAATLDRLAREVNGPIVLFVGQLLPHKRPDLLLHAYHVLCTYLVPEAHLILAGLGRQPRYRRALERVIEELALDAHITGWVPQSELVALYRSASCFVTMSEHEGFCVPVLEAMTFDVPVLARRHGAIAETAGDAAVLLPPDDDPLLAAEAMARLVGDEALRRELIHRGRARVARFDAEQAQATFLSHLRDVIDT